jgi:hypothetical protein
MDNLFHKCRYCWYCYCSDTTKVDGLDCRKKVLIKIIELDKVVDCDNYTFSLLKLILGV